jgi:hypothetical protein
LASVTSTPHPRPRGRGGTSTNRKAVQMTDQMQRLLSRVDGVSSPVAPVALIGEPATSEPSSAGRRAREAHRRAIRKTRERAGVLTGRVPRALEALIASDPSDLHDELLASGLL